MLEMVDVTTDRYCTLCPTVYGTNVCNLTILMTSGISAAEVMQHWI
jgi:hypothetical protein